MSRGHDRERRIRQQLEDDGWIVVRAAGSLGPVDLVALRSGFRPRIIEVKSTHRGPFHSFGPQERREMRLIAIDAGADCELAWWPPRGELRWLPSSQWPEQQRRNSLQEADDDLREGRTTSLARLRRELQA